MSEQAQQLVIEREVDYTQDFNEERANVAVFLMDKATVERIVELQQLAIDNRIEEICVYDSRVRWLSLEDPDEFSIEVDEMKPECDVKGERRTEIDRLEVTDGGLWRFCASDKYVDNERYATQYRSIDELADQYGVPRAKPRSTPLPAAA